MITPMLLAQSLDGIMVHAAILGKDLTNYLSWSV